MFYHILIIQNTEYGHFFFLHLTAVIEAQCNTVTYSKSPSIDFFCSVIACRKNIIAAH